MNTCFFRLTFCAIALFCGTCLATTRYVDLNSTNPAPPYGSWSTASTNIQNAIDAAVAGDQILVTNGVYKTGGRAVVGTMTNRVGVYKPVAVRSVNGPAMTTIEGYPAPYNPNGARCVYLAANAVLSGFTLTKGATQGDFDGPEISFGAAVWCESISATVSNCVIVGNTGFAATAYSGSLVDCLIASNAMYVAGGTYASVLNRCTLRGNTAGTYGGGAMESTLKRCLLVGNSAGLAGGGVEGGGLNDCIVTGNHAQIGGGIYAADATNCTVTGNAADNSGGGAFWGTNYNCILFFNTCTNEFESDSAWSELNFCCTSQVTNGVGNFTNVPLFVNAANGDFGLQTNSPCINAGNNVYASEATDFDGNPRIAGGTVDVGAYEFQSPSSILPYAWAQQYGLPLDGSMDNIDTDGDGVNNWQESRARTNPNDSLSLLKIVSITESVPGPVINWQSVNSVSYYVQRGQNLTPASFSTVQSNIIGSLTGMSSYTDTNAAGSGPYFYRIGVQ